MHACERKPLWEVSDLLKRSGTPTSAARLSSIKNLLAKSKPDVHELIQTGHWQGVWEYNSLLGLACKSDKLLLRDKIAVCELLLDAKAIVDNPHTYTPLSTAIESDDNVELVRMLLKRGACLNELHHVSIGRALHASESCTNLKLLLDSKMDPNMHIQPDFISPAKRLLDAALEQFTGTVFPLFAEAAVLCLLQQPTTRVDNPHKNKHGDTLLHRVSSFECVQLLVEKFGLDPLEPDAEGRTAFHIHRNDSKITAWLVKRGGPDVFKHCVLGLGVLTDPVLTKAVVAAHGGDVAQREKFVNHGSFYGRTPLQTALGQFPSCFESIQILVDAKADVNTVGWRQSTRPPIQMLCDVFEEDKVGTDFNALQTLRFFIRRGVQPRTDKYGRTPLMRLITGPGQPIQPWLLQTKLHELEADFYRVPRDMYLAAVARLATTKHEQVPCFVHVPKGEPTLDFWNYMCGLQEEYLGQSRGLISACVVCKAPCVFKCGECKAAAYCSKAHQTLDLERHRCSFAEPGAVATALYEPPTTLALLAMHTGTRTLAAAAPAVAMATEL